MKMKEREWSDENWNKNGAEILYMFGQSDIIRLKNKQRKQK